MKIREWQKIVFLILISLVFWSLFLRWTFGSLSVRDEVQIETGYLELVLAGDYPEQAVDDQLLSVLGEGFTNSIHDVIRVVRKARTDDRIQGIVLRPVALAVGWPRLAELRTELLEFKSSGKPIYAYLEAAGNREYYIASVADTIAGISSGLLFVNGFLSQPTFIKGTLEKIGIQADFVAHGKYKNAPDQYLRKSMSEPQREVINSILDEYYAGYRDDLATARGIDIPAMNDIINHGFYTLAGAKSAGLIDTLMFYNELKDFLEGDAEHAFTSMSTYQSSPFPFSLSANHKIAVIYGVGTIVIGGEGLYDGSGLITSDGMSNAIRRAAKDDDVDAIILRINSPGGSGTASEIIWNEVVKARRKKPVIASVSDMAASGGYYVIMAADSIIAHPNSIVGSIGVFAGKFSWKDFYDKIGVSNGKIYRGDNADLFSTDQGFTPQQRSIMQNFIMEFYQDFISKVAEGRGMTIDSVDAIAQGRVWTGQQGLSIGLVDKLGDFRTAINVTKKMIGLSEEDKVTLVSYPEMRTVLQRFLGGQIKSASVDLLPIIGDLPLATRQLILALPYFKDGEPLYLMPYDLNIK